MRVVEIAATTLALPEHIHVLDALSSSNVLSMKK